VSIEGVVLDKPVKDEMFTHRKGYFPNSMGLDSRKDMVPLQNRLSPTEKLQLVPELAQDVVSIHGYEEGAIIHGDIAVDQWII
jgi:hypothetical protein